MRGELLRALGQNTGLEEELARLRGEVGEGERRRAGMEKALAQAEREKNGYTRQAGRSVSAVLRLP